MSGLAQGGIMKIPTEQLVFMGVHVAQTVAYIFASSNYCKKRRELKDFSSDVFIVKKLEWLMFLVCIFHLFFLLYFIVVVLLLLSTPIGSIGLCVIAHHRNFIYAIGYSAIATPNFSNHSRIDLQSFELHKYTPVNIQEIQIGFPNLKKS